MTDPPDLSTYLVQHLKLDHQLHAGQRPHSHAPILATGGTVRFTGAEDHLVYLWDPSTVEGMPIWAFLLSSPGQATHMGTTVFCPSPLDPTPSM